MTRSFGVIAAVAIGGAVGSIARYLLATTISERAGTAFPSGTLIVNLLGCAVIGFLMRVFLETGEFSPAARALVTTGFCGGFTTFSTFAWESIAAIEEGAWRRAGMYVSSSLVLGLAAAWIGSSAAQSILGAVRRTAA